MPKRIQRKREKGWRLPPGAVCVTRPGVFGNPFRAGLHGAACECVGMFRSLLELSGVALSDFVWKHALDEDAVTRLRQNAPTLRGKDLACFCPPGSPCHADVLLEFANREGK